MALDVVGTPTLAEPPEATDVSQASPAGQTHWAVTGYEADASAAIEIKAAESGKYHYITHVIMACIDVLVIPRLQDEDDVLLFGPICGAVTAGIVVNHRFRRPIKMGLNKALEVKAAAGGIPIYVEGFTAAS